MICVQATTLEKMNSVNYSVSIFDQLRVRSLVLWFVFGLVIVIVAASILTLDFGDPLEELLLFGFMTIWPLFWLWLKLNKVGVTWRAFIGRLPNQRSWIRWIIITMGVLVFSIGCIFLLWYPLSFVSPRLVESLLLSESPYLFNDGTPTPFPLLAIEFIYVIILAPFAEELIFRGIVLQRWATKWGIRKGIVLSSLVFGILHLDPIGGVFFGFVMAILYIRSRTLLVPIFCHAVNNAVAYFLEGIDFWITGPIVPSIDEFRSVVWIGVVCLVLTVPWAIFFVARNWPGEESQIIYSPEPVTAQDVEIVARPPRQ
ncbi:MAG: CPBP family intramembrane metalloprotease [Planctomycetota bacterium]|nr:MAG: CPBP family intramembrane metalloprotease [Planctomycetota bacterium]